MTIAQTAGESEKHMMAVLSSDQGWRLEIGRKTASQDSTPCAKIGNSRWLHLSLLVGI